MTLFGEFSLDLGFGVQSGRYGLYIDLAHWSWPYVDHTDGSVSCYGIGPINWSVERE